MPDVKEKQVALARMAGIDGFCYWHYWFNGKRLLDTPINQVYDTGAPDFPFCFCWANHSWYAKTWNKDTPDKLLIEQTYPDDDDLIQHFNYNLKFFKDNRYIKIENKPLFGIYSPQSIPNRKHYIELWNKLAIEQGFAGIHFFAMSQKKSNIDELKSDGFQTEVLDLTFLRKSTMRYTYWLMHKLFGWPQIIDYTDYYRTVLKYFPFKKDVMPVVIPNFDHTPRSGNRGSLMIHSTPENWHILFRDVYTKLENVADENKMIFVKSWNEWGEGNYLEPDLKYGRAWLEAMHI